jgi:hypothetical protein
MFHYIYQINVGKKFYIGKRSSKLPPQTDPYMGSGNVVRRYKRMFGTQGMQKIILETCWSEKEALSREHEIVTWKMVRHPNCLNRIEGGQSLVKEVDVPIADPETGNKTRTYLSWEGMWRRYKNEVCEAWSVWSQFFHDMGEKPQGIPKSVTLERHEKSLPFSKNNCYWKVAPPTRNKETGKPTGTYKAYTEMKARNPKEIICEDWLHDWNCFYNDMGKKPEARYSELKRHDNSLPWSKENCYWKIAGVPTKDPRTGKSTKMYDAWRCMKKRNRNMVCEEWLDNYSQFYNDMGEKVGTLKRYDMSKPFSKSNCYWKTK